MADAPAPPFPSSSPIVAPFSANKSLTGATDGVIVGTRVGGTSVGAGEEELPDPVLGVAERGARVTAAR